MSFTLSFCDVRSIESRENARASEFNLVLENAWFHVATACCDRLSKFAPKPGKFSVVEVTPLLGENPCSALTV